LKRYDEQLAQAVNDSTMLNGKTNWLSVQRLMREEGREGSTEMWRSRWRRMKKKGQSGKRRVSEIGIEEVERRKSAGENIEVWFENGELWYETKPKLPIGTSEIDLKRAVREFKVALVSDTHIGHKKSAMDELQAFYEYAYDQGVREFFHAGDISDGMYKNRDNSFFEQNAHGFSEQVDMIINNYPKMDGVTTYFITGNHDITHLRNGGANIGETIDRIRDDMVYLGHNFAKVWLTDEVDLNLIHPTDGGARLINHKIQRIIDEAEGLRRSCIMAVGHYHKMAWLYWKGVYGFVMPSFQHQTDFMRDNNLKSYVGGFILTLKVDRDGRLVSIVPEYYDLGEYK